MRLGWSPFSAGQNSAHFLGWGNPGTREGTPGAGQNRNMDGGGGSSSQAEMEEAWKTLVDLKEEMARIVEPPEGDPLRRGYLAIMEAARRQIADCERALRWANRREKYEPL